MCDHPHSPQSTLSATGGPNLSRFSWDPLSTLAVVRGVESASCGASGDDGINRSQWRIGDQMPFRMDGVEVERVAPNAAKANSAWRLGDAQRTPLQTGEPHVTPRPDGIGEPKAVGVAVRERRLREHTDDLIQKLQMVPPLGDHVQRLRRGEFRM